jgi:hypothetical protein
MTKWCVYTPDRIRVYNQEGVMGVGTKGVDPRIFLIRLGVCLRQFCAGQPMRIQSFVVGKPRRYSLKGLYLAASELFYDLQKGSELFAHPIPCV